MNHPGKRLSALVDGELGHGDRERVLSHLAKCEACRFEAEMLRTLKRRLHALGPPEPAADFLGRLRALSGDGASSSSDGTPPDPPRSGPGAFGSAPPLGSSRPIGGGLPRVSKRRGSSAMASADPRSAAAEPAPAAERVSRFRPNWARARYAVAGASVIAVAMSAAFIAGEAPSGVPGAVPVRGDFEAEHDAASDRAPLPGSAVIPIFVPASSRYKTVDVTEPAEDGPEPPGAGGPR